MRINFLLDRPYMCEWERRHENNFEGLVKELGMQEKTRMCLLGKLPCP